MRSLFKVVLLFLNQRQLLLGKSPALTALETVAAGVILSSHHRPLAHNSLNSYSFYSLIFYILDGVRQRLVPGFWKEKDNKASKDGTDSIDDPGQGFRICC